MRQVSEFTGLKKDLKIKVFIFLLGLFLIFYNFGILTNQFRNTSFAGNLVLAFGFFLIFYSLTHTGFLKNYYLALLAAICLRAVIPSITTVGDRSNDFDGHVQYLQYILTNWSVPPAQQCWQCYQPPGFYFLEAAFTKLIGDNPTDLFTLPILPLILSFFCVYFAVCIFKLWLPDPKLAIYAVPFLVIPGSVHTEISFNNDALTSFFVLLIFLLGSMWYKKPSNLLLVVVSLLVSLGLLNKLSVVPIGAWWFLIVIIKSSDLITTFKQLATVGLLVVALNAPYYLYRLKTENKIEAIGNISGLNRQLSVDANIKNFLIFNPLGVIAKPFVNPWENGYHRERFLEYAFLSALFGEKQYRHLTFAKFGVLAVIIPVGLVIFYLLFNINYFISKQFPAISAAIILLTFLAINRFLYPFSSSNNFRYIASISVVFAIIFADILSELSPKTQRFFAASLVIGLATIWKVILDGS